MILRFCIAGYLLGMMVFLIKAKFELEVWNYVYSVWDKSISGGFVIWYLLAKYSKERRLVLPVMWLALSRFLWELFSWIWPLPINHPIAVLVLFIILTVATGYAILNKDSGIANFLDKNTP